MTENEYSARLMAWSEPMIDKSTYKRYLFFVLPIGLFSFIAVAILSVWSIGQLEEALNYERKAIAVRSSIDDLLQYLQDAETAQRGFLLTGNKAYYEAYLHAVPKIPLALTDLARMTHQIPGQIETLNELDILIAQVIKELRLTVSLRLNSQGAEALSIFRSEKGEHIFNRIRADLDLIDDAAKEKAARHEVFVAKFSRVLKYSIAYGSVFTLLLIVCFGLLTLLEIRRRSRTERELIDAQKSALVASKMKSQFLATVSHEVRTPLNGIIGMSELLKSKEKDPENRRYASVIHSSGVALLKIVNDILDFSKIESGRIELEMQQFSIAELVESVCELFSAKASEKNLAILSYIDPNIPKILEGDSSRISQVLRNLVNNAVKFTVEGTILVEAKMRFVSGAKAVVRFEVKDTGCGISSDDQLVLFKPFHQGNNQAHATSEGTGLGLAISKNLVERLGGLIGVNSEPDLGSTFWFEVPLKSERSLANATPAPRTPQLKGEVICISNSTHLDELMARYSEELGVTIVCVQECERAIDSRWSTILIDIDDLANQRLSELLAQIPNLSERLVILTRRRTELGLPQVKRILRFPFTRTQFLAALTGREATEVQLPPPTIALNTRPESVILLVEDNQTNQILTEAMLSELGYRVHTVANGQECLEALERVPYDLILMDCQMPVMNGFDATKEIRLRESVSGSRTPIVALTANAMTSDREKCSAAGMDDFLSKPFQIQDLANILKKWIGAPKSGPVAWEVLHDLAKKTNSEVVKRLIDSFLKTLPQSLHAMSEALKNGDSKGVSSLAHRLKSSSASLGAFGLNRYCTEIENLAESNSELSDLSAVVVDLQNEGEGVIKEFQKQQLF